MDFCFTWNIQEYLILECLFFFPYFFRTIGINCIQYFENCMNFCLTQNISESLNFQIFVFSHTFFILWEFSFPMFWESYGFTGKISADLWVGKIWIFPSILHKMGKYSHLSPKNYRMIWLSTEYFHVMGTMYILRQKGLPEVS